MADNVLVGGLPGGGLSQQELVKLLTQQDGITQGQLDAKSQLAQGLLQSSRQTTSPIVAALAGFLGQTELQNLAKEQGGIDRRALATADQQRAQAIAFKEREFGFKERALVSKEKVASAQIRKLSQETKSLQEKASKGNLTTKEILTFENNLRDDFTKASGEFVDIRNAASRVFASAKDPSAAGDLALIFNYMKVLDPGSTVREGEFATAQNSGGVDDITVALYNKIRTGERLAGNVRDDFVDRTGRLFKASEAQQAQNVSNFTGLAERAPGVEAQNVVIDLGIVEQNLQKETVKPVKADSKIKFLGFE